MLHPPQHEITQALKHAFKAQGVTYQDVADRIGVSEQTIKRLFRDKDCSLSRLSEVCHAINISMYDLLEVAKEFSEPLVKLSNEQEDWLAKNPSHFHFLFFLTSDYTAEDIQRRYRLSDTVLFRYLRDLDKHGLIVLGVNNSYKLKVEGKLLMRLDSKLAYLVRKRNQEFLNHVFENHTLEDNWFASSFRFMSSDTLSALQHEMKELMQRYQKAAYQDQAILPKEKLKGVKWSTIAAPYEVCSQWPMNREIN